MLKRVDEKQPKRQSFEPRPFRQSPGLGPMFSRTDPKPTERTPRKDQTGPVAAMEARVGACRPAVHVDFQRVGVAHCQSVIHQNEGTLTRRAEDRGEEMDAECQAKISTRNYSLS